MEQRFGFLLPCLQLLRKNLWQRSLKMLKICQKDWQDFQNASQNIQESNSRNVIKLQRSMWNVQCKYSSVPEDTFVNLTENFLNSERNQGLQFTRSNSFKIGFNCLSNRLQKISFSLRNNSLQDSNVVFKMKCKKLFITDELAKF